jgi:hypothetical protein
MGTLSRSGPGQRGYRTTRRQVRRACHEHARRGSLIKQARAEHYGDDQRQLHHSMGQHRGGAARCSVDTQQPALNPRITIGNPYRYRVGADVKEELPDHLLQVARAEPQSLNRKAKGAKLRAQRAVGA